MFGLSGFVESKKCAMSVRRNDFSIEYRGDEVGHPLTLEQIGIVVRAALKSQDYAPGSRCIVRTRRIKGDRYAVGALAQEPAGDLLRLLDLELPADGIEQAEFEQVLEENGLTPFVASSGVVVAGGWCATGQGSRVSRHDGCPCGSGQKYEYCCLQ